MLEKQKTVVKCNNVIKNAKKSILRFLHLAEKIIKKIFFAIFDVRGPYRMGKNSTLKKIFFWDTLLQTPCGTSFRMRCSMKQWRQNQWRRRRSSVQNQGDKTSWTMKTGGGSRRPGRKGGQRWTSIAKQQES